MTGRGTDENPSVHLELDDAEKADIRKKIAEVTPDDEAKVRREFAAKYGAVGKTLLNSQFKAVRDLALNVASLWEMLVDPDYTVPWTTTAQIVFALAYFISPVDAIPDVIPVVGYVDDAIVVGYIVYLLADDIRKYRQWRREQGRPLPSV